MTADSAPLRPDRTIRIAWISLPLQFFGGGALLGFALAVLLLFTGTYDGLMTMLGSLVGGALYAVPAMVLALLIGLPLRISRLLRRWWMTHGWWLFLGLAIAGLAGSALSFVMPGSVDLFQGSTGPGTPEGYVRHPNQWVFHGSILIAGLGLCHLLPPIRLTPPLDSVTRA